MASGQKQDSAARRPTGPESGPSEPVSRLVRSARRYAARCHARQRRQSDGAAFIEHPLEVARLLRDAGCSETVIAAGLLHDVIEDTHIDVTELTACFGSAVAGLVKAVSDDASITSYRQRKQLLRQQVRRAGHDAALLFAADKIAKVRELAVLVSRDRARFDATPHANRPAGRQLEQDYQLRLEHYHESLNMLQHIAPQHPLTQRLADELNDCLTTINQITAAANAPRPHDARGASRRQP